MFILKEYAQGAPDEPVRVEVMFTMALPNGQSISQAVKIDPIADDSIGDGGGAWSAEDLLDRVSEIIGEPVEFPPKPEPVAQETPAGLKAGLEG